jgi:hypothetical protein
MIASRPSLNASATKKEKQTQNTFINLSLCTTHTIPKTPFIVTKVER